MREQFQLPHVSSHFFIHIDFISVSRILESIKYIVTLIDFFGNGFVVKALS